MKIYSRVANLHLLEFRLDDMNITLLIPGTYEESLSLHFFLSLQQWLSTPFITIIASQVKGFGDYIEQKASVNP